MWLHADVKIDFFFFPPHPGLMDVELLLWTANDSAVEIGKSVSKRV